MLSIISAKYENNYTLQVKFNDGKEGMADLREFIFNDKLKPFSPLKDIEKFKNFTIDYTIKWSDELDIAPEYLYFKAFEHEEILQTKFQEWGYAV